MRFSASVVYVMMMIGSGVVAGFIAGISIGISLLLKSESYIHFFIAGQFGILAYFTSFVVDEFKKRASRKGGDNNIKIIYDSYYKSLPLIIVSTCVSFSFAILCAKLTTLLFMDIASYSPVYFSFTVMMIGVFYFQDKFIRVQVTRKKPGSGQ